MNWVFLEIKEKSFPSPLEQPYMIYEPPPPPPVQSNGFNLNDKVSPSVLLIIIILAIIFFVSGLLHLFVRFLLRPSNRDPDEVDNVTALQGQLQQLFNLHDCGVDQSFIDTLPVFNYKSIIGVETPFDCAVCLCEFEPEDKLRLLPKCSHAFHMECIDTWLLAHSTCPLCRATLLSDFSSNNGYSPIVLVLESGSESSREIVPDREGGSNSHFGAHCDNEFRLVTTDLSRKSCEIQVKEDENQQTSVDLNSEEKVVAVKLGKFKNVDGGTGGEGSSNNSVDSRRCFSMGSFAYVMNENTSLQVPIRTPMKKQSIKKSNLPLTPGHRLAMSECDCDSRREFNGFEAFRSIEIGPAGGTNSVYGNRNNATIGRSKKESFSVSKIWLHGRKDKSNSTSAESSVRAFSFRFPVQRDVGAADDLKPKNGGSGTRRTISAIDIGRWENGRSQEFGCDEEIQRSFDSQGNPPSFTSRTLRWLMGRQNKVVHSSFSQNV